MFRCTTWATRSGGNPPTRSLGMFLLHYLCGNDVGNLGIGGLALISKEMGGLAAVDGN